MRKKKKLLRNLPHRTIAHFMTIISKLPDVGDTIFSVMTALAQEYQAINLAQGFPRV